ncbi:MAG TPA: clan AA aspartic protease [Blastocatellia bacterium]|nr:clan AA aspartic protease [Blastocatellia bacterium]
MITGKVTANREATIEFEVNGFGQPPHQVEAVIDTGFNGYLTLPNQLIGLLNLPSAGNRSATLGDGSAVVLDAYLATVPWHGQDRDVLVLEAEGGALIGMSLLHGSRLSMEVMDDGEVTIEELESSAHL